MVSNNGTEVAARFEPRLGHDVFTTIPRPCFNHAIPTHPEYLELLRLLLALTV